MPARPSPNASDHDLLIRIDTKVDVLTSTVQETRTALSARIDRLAQDKANVTELDPLRKMIERQQEQLNAQCDELTAKADKSEFDGVKRLVLIGVGIVIALNVFVVPPLVSVAIYWLTRPK